MAEQQFKPVLSLWDATMIVAGSMIGSGIFIVSANISMNVGSAGWLIAVWLLTGFMTVTAAVSYGELSGMFPKAGGQYTYLKEAYNPLIAFLYGWSFFAVIQTGTIAAVGVAFSKFTAYLIPAVSENIVLFEAGFIKISPAQLLAIVTIILLTYINTRGVKEGKWIQSVLTTVKLLSLFGLIVAGFFAFKPEVWQANWQDAWSMKKLLPDGRIETYLTIGALGAIASAMVGSIFSSDAWNNVTFIAGEIRNPQRNIGLSLFLGTLIVTVIYVSANFMYTGILPLNEIAFAENDRVGVAASTVIFGAAGTIVIAIMIMVSTFGCNNGLILSGARVYYTMAKDGLFFKQAGELNQASVPQKALWMQGVLASVWCLSGRYGDLLDMISFVVVLFYMLTIAGIFILRKKQPNMARPYKAFGYPLLPFIYMLMGTAFCMLLIVYKPQYTWPGFIITLLGIPLYYLALRNKQSKGVVK
ncbi:MAG: amino acid permease [Cyclobacteriaceae bacterium]|jgi:APA family basic amino acid/polyamine antiporter|nr:amino acid permease [Cytophagales bacterium]MCZ8327278.1 amino acid permease [Cyclobacteriaceae bacterium]